VNFAIACPDCGRLTYPNLGVNLPAGMAWSMSASQATNLLRAMEKLTQFHVEPLNSYMELREKVFK